MNDNAVVIPDPVQLIVAAELGRLVGSNERYAKMWSDLHGVYRDAVAFEQQLAEDDGEPAYWVESSTVANGPGALTIGLSVLEPGRIGDEFTMTRGHLHSHPENAELYYGVSGKGVMLLETEDGQSKAIEIGPGQAVHVPGHWLHRSVNVGTERLVTVFCYATNAGQDYAVIEQAGGMKNLVVAKGDGWVVRTNPDHRGYRA